MIPDLAGQRVVVVGLGLFGGGLGAAKWALDRGAWVTVTDLRDAEVLAPTLLELTSGQGQERLNLTLGEHQEADFLDADWIVINPGIPPHAEVMGMATRSPGVVTTAMAWTLGQASCRVAAITGTQGKSSTATFLAQAMRHGGTKVELGGNIGGSLLHVAADLGPADLLVLELSSYQLHHMPRSVAQVIDVAIVTNIGEDHLAWHGSVEAYQDSKRRIASLVRPGGSIIAPAAHREAMMHAAPDGVRFISHGKGAEIQVATRADSGHHTGLHTGRGFFLGDANLGATCDLRVPGDFQVPNAACALAAAHLMGAPAHACSAAVPSLRGLPHRMESLGAWSISVGGASPRRFRVIDNGISTTPESTLAAMASVDRGQPEPPHPQAQRILMAGGAAKRGLGFAPLAEYAAANGWLVAPFGAAEATLRRAAEDHALSCAPGPLPETAPGTAAGLLEAAPERASGAAESLDEVWQRIRPIIQDGAIVLFSPACASFDAFPNFQSRAVAFRALLRASGTERKD